MVLFVYMYVVCFECSWFVSLTRKKQTTFWTLILLTKCLLVQLCHVPLFNTDPCTNPCRVCWCLLTFYASYTVDRKSLCFHVHPHFQLQYTRFFFGGGVDTCISSLWRILIDYLLYNQYRHISFDLKTAWCGRKVIDFRNARAAAFLFIQWTLSGPNLIFRINFIQDNCKWITPWMWFSNSRVNKNIYQTSIQKLFKCTIWPPPPPLLLLYPFFLSKRKGQGSFSINTTVIKSFGITNFRLTLFNEIGIFVLNQYLYMCIFNNGFFVCYVVLCLKNSFQLYEWL